MTRAIQRGQLTIHHPDGTVSVIGEPDPAFRPVTVRFADWKSEHAILRDPDLGAGEAFMDGRMRVDGDDIAGLLDLLFANNRFEARATVLTPKGLGRVARDLKFRVQRINRAVSSKRNVAHHYDLSDRLYDLFLDADRQYSCAYFTDPANTLEQAQLDKKAHIAAKLALKPGMTVLDIGCGWGGMALYLNRHYGVDVTGITLSEEQIAVAQRRAREAGVSDRVRFELIDYRALEGRFDRIVSVGMFEHVGQPQFGTFFTKCRSLLAEDGVMLLHTIGRMGPPGVTDAFTAKYIFPGGYIPALSEVLAAVEPLRFPVTDVEVLRLHYAYTLEHWYERTRAAREAVIALYDERFYRMWLFYLAGAMVNFRHGGLVIHQIQLARDRHALPITRDYMVAEEARLRAAEPTG